MSAPTFIDILRSEVAKFQTLHPEREGELARAHALILHGQVLPSADDPETGTVLSSDLAKTYTVNGQCSCLAGAHGKACKHIQAWRLYRYIQGKVDAQDATSTPVVTTETAPGLASLPEAPVSITLKASFDGQEVLVTLRGTDFASVKAQVEDASAWLKAHAPAAPLGPTLAGEGVCPIHQVQMRQTTKEGRTWWSHRTAEGWCKGKVRR